MHSTDRPPSLTTLIHDLHDDVLALFSATCTVNLPDLDLESDLISLIESAILAAYSQHDQDKTP